MHLKFFYFLFFAEAVLRSVSFVQAQDTVKVYRLKDVVITTERSNPTKGTISPIAVFNRGKIESSPLQTIEGALKSSPSIDLRERGSMGMQADISVYGGTSDQSMVMLNGVNFTDVRTGHQSHSLPVDIEGVSGIDIISGIPGPGAFSGAVNIMTVPEYNNYVKANFSAGEHGYLYGNLSGAITKSNANLMIIGSLRHSDGYTSNTDFDNQNLYARMMIDAFAALFFGWLYDKRGFKTLIVSTVIAAPFAILTFTATSQAALICGVILWGIGMGAQESVVKSAVADMVPKERRSTGFGIFQASYGLFWFLGSWLMGWLYDWNMTAMIIFSVVSQLAAIPFLWMSSRPRYCNC